MALTVLVTGAGGPAGVAVIRALQSLGHRAVAADADELAAGMRLVPDGAVLPYGNDPGFLDAAVQAALRMKVDALISTVAEEMVALAEGEDALTAAGLAVWVASGDALVNCIDKWRFACLLAEVGLPAPPTGLGSAKGVPGPWIVKPRFGRGSRDVFSVQQPEDLAWALRRVPEPIVQTCLTGREFTVDALVGRDGLLAGAVPRWRLEVKAGISTKGLTFADASLVALVGRLLAAVGLHGAANVQGFVADDGTTTFTEVNPRFSGGLPLSLASGADLVGEYLRGTLGRPLHPERLQFRAGVSMVRYYHEVFQG